MKMRMGILYSQKCWNIIYRIEKTNPIFFHWPPLIQLKFLTRKDYLLWEKHYLLSGWNFHENIWGIENKKVLTNFSEKKKIKISTIEKKEIRSKCDE